MFIQTLRLVVNEEVINNTVHPVILVTPHQIALARSVDNLRDRRTPPFA
jgi:hypothetical protein